ncbi:hypothetical protein AMTR_s00004p00117700 [Amborella trichopoda]|uniref:DRBM domain-containing protein n=1 Tax=Amborella trichopoda TaxID=13333 RepID=W1NDZ7_AMBTC|nr:hypothetical protein AMTR_s00004p00117700 [Amborella trichopoda]
MYKNRLQELCHQKKWSFPNYSTSRDGPDHNPRFSTSVTLNGLKFESPVFCRSSKESQNEAARAALEALTMPQTSHLLSYSSVVEASGVSRVTSPQQQDRGLRGLSTNMSEKCDVSSPHCGPSTTMNEKCDNLPQPCNPSSSLDPNGKEMKETQSLEGSSLGSSENTLISLNVDDGGKYLYKNLLQEFVQKRGLDMPIYSCVGEGVDHAPRFKAIVTVDGHTFDSSSFFSTLREAEHAVAKIALTSLSSGEDIQQDESPLCKNLLQELMQKEGLPIPEYRTARSGAPHLPTFFSTIEVDGEVFSGKAAKTRKEAEMSAAKVAYFRFNERKSSQNQNLQSLSSSCMVEVPTCSSNAPSTSEMDTEAPNSPVKCQPTTSEAATNGSHLYKNLLQELAQKEGLPLPEYKTVRSGEPHLPIFSSTVEVDGKSFSGKPAKNKKEAELDAARVAYFNLKDGRSDRILKRLHSSGMVEVSPCAASNASTTVSMEDTTKAIEERILQRFHSSGMLEVSPCASSNASTTVSMEDTTKAIEEEISSKGERTAESPQIELDAERSNKKRSIDMGSDGPNISPPDSKNSSVISVSEPSLGKESRAVQRLVVIPNGSKMVLPKSAEVLPFSDNKQRAEYISMEQGVTLP